jgi:RimK family alpha-L-glutamate ligase
MGQRAAAAARQRIVAVVGGAANGTNRLLVTHWRSLGLRAELLAARDARSRVGACDVVLGRLDVLPALDGVEAGLLELMVLERAGLDVRNGVGALLAAHDKLRTARALVRAGVPHPRAGVVSDPVAPLPVRPPLVVKPRFGGWGRDVERCWTEGAARECLRRAAHRPWFRRHGALVQELVGGGRNDLRLIVAGGRVIGAVRRTAPSGDWRTNVSLGAAQTPVVPDDAARALALQAAQATGSALAGVDLVPLSTGAYAVLEVDGAGEFDEGYALTPREIFRDAARALGLFTPAPTAPPRPGDTIAAPASGHTLGSEVAGRVLEVVGATRAPLYRVRWSAGHESMYRPGRHLRILRRSGRDR